MAKLDEFDDLAGAYTVKRFAAVFGISLAYTYLLIKDRKLRAVKAGTRTLILRRDALAWANSLPEMRSAAS